MIPSVKGAPLRAKKPLPLARQTGFSQKPPNAKNDHSYWCPDKRTKYYKLWKIPNSPNNVFHNLPREADLS